MACFGSPEIKEDSRIRRWLLGALVVIPLCQIFLQFWIQIIITKFHLGQRFLPYVLTFDAEPKFLPGSAELVGISSDLLLLVAGGVVLFKWADSGLRQLFGVVVLFVGVLSAIGFYESESVYKVILLLLVFGTASLAMFISGSNRTLCILTTAIFLFGALFGNLPAHYLKRQAFISKTKSAVASNNESGRASIEAAYELGLIGGSAAIVQEVRRNFNSGFAAHDMCDESLIAEGIWRKRSRKSNLCTEFKDLRNVLDIVKCEDPDYRGKKGAFEDEIKSTTVLLSHHARIYNFCSNPEDNARPAGISGWLMLFYEILQAASRLISHVFDLLQILSYGIRLQFLDRPVYSI